MTNPPTAAVSIRSITPNSLSRRNLMGLALSLGSTAALVGCTPTYKQLATSAEAPQLMRLDYSSFSPVSFVTRYLGDLDDSLRTDGLDAVWIGSPDDYSAVEDMDSKSYLVAATSGASLLQARIAGAKIKAISVISEPNWCAIMTAKKSPITSLLGLKGKRIAVLANGETFSYLLRALHSVKLTLADVTPIFLGPLDGLLSMESGACDAWVAFAPLLQQAADHDQILHRDPLWTSHCFLVAHENTINQRPELLQTVVNSFEATRKWMFLNLARGSDKMATESSITPRASFIATTDSNPFVPCVPTKAHLGRIQTVGETLVTAGIVKSEQVTKAVDGIFDLKFAKAAPFNDYLKLATL